MVNVGLTGDYKKIPQRDCTITIASYESPDALRGDSYSLVQRISQQREYNDKRRYCKICIFFLRYS